MSPSSKPTLSIRDIADYWSREIDPPASKDELFDTLVAAWWLDEFRGDSRHSRLELLKIIFTSRYRNELGIVFIEGDRKRPLPVELPDGSCEVDIRPEIPIPSSNLETWNEAACRDAFQALAEITERSSIDSYRHHAVLLPSIKLTYEQFNTYRRKRGYPKPKFWRPTLQAPKLGRPAEYNWDGVKKLLRTYVRKNGPVQTSQELMEKCANFACDLHPKHKVPNDKTIREAIKMHALDVAAFAPGK